MAGNATGNAGRGGSAGGGAGAGGAGGGTACNITTATGTDFLAAQSFCEQLVADCATVTSGGGTIPTGYMTVAACMTSYSAAARTDTNRHCQSYHLCWGVEGNTNSAGANPMTHCQHAWAGAVCN
jgi:hypothetical protein